MEAAKDAVAQLHRGVPGYVCSCLGVEGAQPMDRRWWCGDGDGWMRYSHPGCGLGTEGEHPAGSHPTLLQPPAREGFCFAKQPSLRRSRADRSHLLVPGPGTGGIKSPVALAARSGMTAQHALPASPRQVPAACPCLPRAAPRVPQPAGCAQARHQPTGDRARGDLQLHS